MIIVVQEWKWSGEERKTLAATGVQSYNHIILIHVLLKVFLGRGCLQLNIFIEFRLRQRGVCWLLWKRCVFDCYGRGV